MADAGKAVEPDVVKAWAVVEDILGEVGPVAVRIDVEALLEVARGFVAEEHKWVRMWRQEDHGLAFTIHRDSVVIPIKDARWLVDKILDLELLPRRQDDDVQS